MDTEAVTAVVVEQKTITSSFLNREIIIDFYLPGNISDAENLHLLLINDGQDLLTMNFSAMLHALNTVNSLQPLLCVGIHAGEDRRMEYGTAKILDFKNRGAKAAAYNSFLIEELMPLIENAYGKQFKSKSMAGFSLGGLTAIDAVWNHPDLFRVAGVFSGSLWWRTKDMEEGYNEDTDRIMHRQVREGQYNSGLRFYFTTGSLDETADRNNNGIIDSIDDTLALVEELKEKGYGDADIQYINYEDGRHDVATWGRAMPDFLLWGWGSHLKENESPFESC